MKHELPTKPWSCRPSPNNEMAAMDMWEVNHGTETECVAENVYGEEAARLIAAAPELLEALKDARRRSYIAAAVDAARWTTDTEKQNEYAAKAVTEIDALIAKATHP